MKPGDLVIRIDNAINCDSGPPINVPGIVVDITPSNSIFIYWPDVHEGYVMGYSNNIYEIGNLEVISESR